MSPPSSNLPPTTPGWVVETMYLCYDGDASAAGSFPNAGLVTAGLDATSDVWILGGLHTQNPRPRAAVKVAEACIY
jgi:hypothetical protein